MGKEKKKKTTKANKKRKARFEMKKKLPAFFSGVILTVLGVIFTTLIQNRREVKQLYLLTPEIKYEIQELEQNKLYFQLGSVNETSAKIDKLFLKFDIPGIFSHYKIHYKDKVQNISISSSFLVGYNGETSAESMLMDVTDLYSNGSFAIYIYYTPSEPIFSNHRYYQSYHFPLLDLHDFSPYYFVWTKNGTTITNKGTFNLDYLPYIKKDNHSLITQDRYTKSSIQDYLTNNPMHPISFLIKDYKSKLDSKLVKIPIDNNSISNDTLIIEADTLLIKSSLDGLYKNYDEIRQMELKRKWWY
jgi:hypothetical protein